MKSHANLSAVASIPKTTRRGDRGTDPNARKKLYVLDTNVYIHDPMSVYQFAEHDIFVPFVTLEELNNHKKGLTDVARNARQTTRIFDELISSVHSANLKDGIPLDSKSGGVATGSLLLQSPVTLLGQLPPAFSQDKPDNQILAVVLGLMQAHPDQEVTLVTKDVAMRAKASALGIVAEDYYHDQVFEDSDLFYAGMREIGPEFWEREVRDLDVRHANGFAHYTISGPVVQTLYPNEFLYGTFRDGKSCLLRVSEVLGNSAYLVSIQDYSKTRVCGITALNDEQNFAMNLLMDPKVDFVSLMGHAGTGKTLLTLAAAIELTFEKRPLYTETIMTRATVSMGDKDSDIGFLPGSEQEKMLPWMGALTDNLEVLFGDMDHGMKDGIYLDKSMTLERVYSKLQPRSMNFMRGRSFFKKFIIVDEAQNLTPLQVKSLITRAGFGTKVVCLGNTAQIDARFLNQGSCGIAYVVDRFKMWSHSGHVTLQKGERSRLSEYANKAL